MNGALQGDTRSLTRVLFVDDDPVVLRAFARAVAGCFDLDTTADPETALCLGMDHQYAVVATDLFMPKFTGFELVSRLRERRPATSFVLVTGAGELDLSQRKDSAQHLSGVIRKPWSEDKLLATLERAAKLYATRIRSERAPPMKVLLVDDDDDDASMTTETLKEHGYAVERHKLLKRGERALRQSHFDVVLTDLSLPDACGLDAVSTLRATTDSAPIVVMTTSFDAALARQATHAGAQGYLVKNGSTDRSLAVAIQCAFERHALERELASRALHDPLTGLANRSALREWFLRARARADRHKSCLSLMLIDLDDFKYVNDQHGHLVGDQVLCGVARALEAAVRDSDLVARIGGDEFVVLAEAIPGHDEEARFRERIVQALRQPIRIGPLRLSTTACVGAARFPNDGDNLESLVCAADDSMYKDKAARRLR